MKKQNGITLIALVISIIVMLILAGVSINAMVGENGVLSRAQYSSFMNEMAAVEEAVQLWKAGELIETEGEADTAIPANGLCKVNDLTATERLVGEIGYYRVWSISEDIPNTNILSSADTFNKNFESEFIYYPAGVQDLYYLDTKSLGLDEDKIYLIDASTSIVYSMTGITLNGVRCYSTHMAKAIMGNNVAPLFAEAEVTGTGSGEKLAGNVQDEYLPDGTKNPDYNPYGFQIIADDTNDNIYKLYNNGDLYGKGKKGNLLNTSREEMVKINANVWNEFSISSEIENIKEIFPGNGTIFILDESNELWAYGENHYNYLGLTQEQQNEYTGRDIVKINVNGKAVSKVIPTGAAIWVITTENELYVCGYNNFGELGIGKKCQQTDKFELVEFNNPQGIKNITSTADDYTDSSGIDYRTIILMEDGTLYFAGNTEKINQKIFKGTDLENKDVFKFTEIFNGKYGEKFDNKVVYIAKYSGWSMNYLVVLDESGNLFELTNDGTIINLDTGVQKIVARDNSTVYMKLDENGEIKYKLCPWGAGSWFNALGITTKGKEYIDITEILVEKFDVTEIKDFFVNSNSVFFLLNNGMLYSAGDYSEMGVSQTSGISDGFVLINDYTTFDNIKELVYLNNAGASSKAGCFMIKDEEDKLYSTGNEALMYRNLILESRWVKLNPEGVKVKKFNAQTFANSLAFIDTNDDIWVLGDDVRFLGINHAEDDIDIKNFVLLKDYLKDSEIYTNIDGKVEDYCFSKGAFYIKTNHKDNNTLYVSGTYEISSWPYHSFSGLDEEDAFIPTKLFEDVKQFAVSYQTGVMVLLNNNDLYIWGNDNGSMTGGITSRIPILYNDYSNSNTEIVNSTINKVFQNNFKSYIITEENVFVTGTARVPDSAIGLPSTAYTYSKLDKGTYFKNENIVNITFLSESSVLFLTEEGNLYGCGNKNHLGFGTASTEQIFTPVEIINDNSVAQIVAGPNWFVIVKKDGTVLGTGANAYGILGRWVGVGRGESNSRYKTAFNWVECPELEI